MTYNIQLIQKEGLGGLLSGSKYAEIVATAKNLWTGDEYKATLINGQWCKISGISYLTDWSIHLYTTDGVKLSEEIKNSYKDKIVGINFATGALGDSLCWSGSVVKWIEKVSPKKVYMATSWSHIFDKSKYPVNLEFTHRANRNEDRTYPQDVEVTHLLGITRNHVDIANTRDNHATPCNWQITNMADTQNMALGVPLGAIRPHLIPLDPKRLHAKPYVTICSYTTQKVKHLLSNKAWMTLIRRIESFGFDVISIGDKHTTFPEIIDACSSDITVAMRYIRDAEFHVGLSSGLSWMAWAYNKHVLMINNFTHEGYEFIEGNTRILNNAVSYGHFNNPNTEWVPTWQFDPDNDNHLQSCRSITPNMLLAGFDELMRKRAIGSMEGTYLDVVGGGGFKPITPLLPNQGEII